MRLRFIGAFILLFASFCCGSAMSSPTIDGNLADWDMGVVPGTDWIPNDPNIYYMLDPNSGSYVGPGYGGQEFDAEAMYAFCATADGYLYVAVVAGTPPDGADYGSETYMPGDIAIDFGQDGGTHEIGIAVPETETTGGPADVMQNPDWTDPTDFPLSEPVSMVAGTGTDIGDAQIAYNNNYYGSDHYVIELAIPLEALDEFWGDPFTIHWTMECGNDLLELPVSAPVVPEASTVLLLGAGLVGTALARRRELSPA